MHRTWWSTVAIYSGLLLYVGHIAGRGHRNSVSSILEDNPELWLGILLLSYGCLHLALHVETTLDLPLLCRLLPILFVCMGTCIVLWCPTGTVGHMVGAVIVFVCVAAYMWQVCQQTWVALRPCGWLILVAFLVLGYLAWTTKQNVINPVCFLALQVGLLLGGAVMFFGEAYTVLRIKA